MVNQSSIAQTQGGYVHNLLLSTLGLDQICWQNFEQNRDLKAMSNLLAKWAVKYQRRLAVAYVTK